MYVERERESNRFTDETWNQLTNDSQQVRDTLTGLIWQRAYTRDYGWTNWTNAQLYCRNLILGGDNDWRLPTIKELTTLMNYTIPAPGINLTALPTLIDQYIWASTQGSVVSTSGANPTSVAWQISTQSSQVGIVFLYYKAGTNGIRCVRNGPSQYVQTSAATNVWPSGFLLLRDVSSLTWGSCRSGTPTMNWTDALSYCSNLKTGWRLPNIWELFTLYQQKDILNEGYNVGDYWSSTSALGNSNNAWNINFFDGMVSNDVKNNFKAVHCTTGVEILQTWDCSAGTYDDTTNQTGRYKIEGIAPNATVTDALTGLMWEQTPSESGHVWNVSAPPWSAQAYCANLAKSGYADWRLPTVVELQSLVDYKIDAPSVNATTFPSMPNANFWTSEVYVGPSGNQVYVYYIEFHYCGAVEAIIGNSNALNVRCVRLGTNSSLNRYTDENGNSLTNTSIQVKDIVTGLVWQRKQAAHQLPWSALSVASSAQAYCQNLVVGVQGAGSWRLPSAKELFSLMNLSTSFPTINTTAFPDTSSDGYWTSSVSTCGSNGAWYIGFGGGNLYFYPNNTIVNNPNFAIYFVRCVRCDDGASTNNGMWSAIAYEDATNQPARYYVSGTSPNAIVTDDFTGLMWEQQVGGINMTWNESATFGSAQYYCKNLNKGDYNDWRVPGIVELQSLVDYTVNFQGPMINTAAFPSTPNTYFWTSQVAPKNSTLPFNVRFNNAGFIHSDGTIGSTLFNVRCVRGIVFTFSFTDERGNTLTNLSTQVSDQMSGLTWQRAQASVPLLWNASTTSDSAQWYCQNLVIGNYGVGSWQLPTIKALTTLLDYALSTISEINNSATLLNITGLFFATTIIPNYSPIAVMYMNINLPIISIHGDIATFSGHVRCLRRSNAPSNNGMWSSIAYQGTTNQTARYYVSGTAPNAIVTDDFTGLMWEQTVSSSTYFWNDSAPIGSAQAYCTGLTKGGYNDWRLPTIVEILSLMDLTVSGVPINTSIFASTPSNYFWTSVSYGTNTPYHANFGNYGTVYHSETTSCNVRCIRSDITLIEDRYLDANGLIITQNSNAIKDIMTGLIWQRSLAETQVVPNLAQTYCNNLVIGIYGAGLWQLPSVKQLSTLVNYTSTVNPMINVTAFPETPNGWFLSSSVIVGLPNAVWTTFFTDGRGIGNTIYQAYVRCVLSNNATSNNGMWSSLAYQDITNQTARYYVAGTTPNASVTDDFTGLMWEQQVSASTYFWNASAPVGSAQAYCASLTKGGYNDWRLPTAKELLSIVDYTLNAPALNTSIFSGSLSNIFWTSTLTVNGGAEIVDFSNLGCSSNRTVNSHEMIHCVRGYTQDLSERYTDENDNPLTVSSYQIKDHLTNLIWQRNESAFMSRYNAPSYCQSLALGTGSWRVPTIKELATLIDYTYYNPAINTTAFPNTSGNYFASSTGVENDVTHTNIMLVDFLDGSIGTSYNIGPTYIRCIQDHDL